MHERPVRGAFSAHGAWFVPVTAPVRSAIPFALSSRNTGSLAVPFWKHVKPFFRFSQPKDCHSGAGRSPSAVPGVPGRLCKDLKKGYTGGVSFLSAYSIPKGGESKNIHLRRYYPHQVAGRGAARPLSACCNGKLPCLLFQHNTFWQDCQCVRPKSADFGRRGSADASLHSKPAGFE